MVDAKNKEIGIYIHIPFCQKKCDYCDFKSYANKQDLIEKYIKWVKYELEGIAEANKLDYEMGRDYLINVKTIYIGGGTPSYIDSKYITEIMQIIKNKYNIMPEVEITIEVNPGTVTKQKLKEYISSGINRISIGLQATNNKLLKQLGRIHTYEEFKNTYNMVREVGFDNINVDLMLGLPNQTIEDIENSVKEIIELKPEHISIYSLIVEEGTKLYQDIESKKLELPQEEVERKMYWTVKSMLEKAGYVHYEISNFAKPNYESKHNMDCWEQKEYIGIGAAAHSYTNYVRYSNIDTIEEYINNYKTGNISDNFVFHEKQDKQSAMKEYMILGLRKIDGVQIKKFKEKYGENPIYIFRKELEKLVNEQLIEIDGDKIKLTDKGLDLANLVWEEFI